MFIDKLAKAIQETSKTQDRLTKLQAKYKEMKATLPQETTQDAYLSLKSLTLEGTKEIDTSRCYIRALIDDDAYCTFFGQMVDGKLSWPDAIYLPLKQRNLKDTCVYVMVCVNTESEISFLDTMLANVSGNYIVV